MSGEAFQHYTRANVEKNYFGVKFLTAVQGNMWEVPFHLSERLRSAKFYSVNCGRFLPLPSPFPSSFF